MARSTSSIDGSKFQMAASASISLTAYMLQRHNEFNPISQDISTSVLDEIWNGVKIAYIAAERTSTRTHPQGISVWAINNLLTSPHNPVHLNIQIYNRGSYRGSYGHGHDCIVAVWKQMYYILWDVKRGSCSHCDTNDAMKEALQNVLNNSSVADRDPLKWWKTAMMSGLVVEHIDDLKPFARAIMNPMTGLNPPLDLSSELRWNLFKRYAYQPFGIERKMHLRLLRKDMKHAYASVEHIMFPTKEFDDIKQLSGNVSVDDILKVMDNGHWIPHQDIRTSLVHRDLRILMMERIKDEFNTVGTRTASTPVFSNQDKQAIAQVLYKFVRIAREFE